MRAIFCVASWPVDLLTRQDRNGPLPTSVNNEGAAAHYERDSLRIRIGAAGVLAIEGTRGLTPHAPNG